MTSRSSPGVALLPRRYCSRYLKVEAKRCRAKACPQFDEIALKPSPPAGSPHPAVIADPQLKAIDDVAVRTLKNCMQGGALKMGRNATVGCGWATCARRRMVNDVTFGHHDLVRRCLYLLPAIPRKMAWFPPMSLFSQRYAPMTPFCLITIVFVDVLYNYLQSTGDTETVGELWPTARCGK